MMTREEIKEIVDYIQEHGITVKRRLQELNVPESNFYYAKRMYAREDSVSVECKKQFDTESIVVGLIVNTFAKERKTTIAMATTIGQLMEDYMQRALFSIQSFLFQNAKDKQPIKRHTYKQNNHKSKR